MSQSVSLYKQNCNQTVLNKLHRLQGTVHVTLCDAYTKQLESPSLAWWDMYDLINNFLVVYLVKLRLTSFKLFDKT